MFVEEPGRRTAARDEHLQLVAVACALLVEPSLEIATQLFAANAAGVVLQVGHIERFNPVMTTLLRGINYRNGRNAFGWKEPIMIRRPAAEQIWIR